MMLKLHLFVWFVTGLKFRSESTNHVVAVWCCIWCCYGTLFILGTSTCTTPRPPWIGMSKSPDQVHKSALIQLNSLNTLFFFPPSISPSLPPFLPPSLPLFPSVPLSPPSLTPSVPPSIRPSPSLPLHCSSPFSPSYYPTD